ncbi:MAG: DUF1848 family protein [Calditrichaceae bacterium]
MKSVISASRRTDIPAFYLKWFMNAVIDGKVEVTNPFYRHKKYIVRLDPDHIEWIVFWSRNYAHFIRHRQFFDAYNLFFHFTILPKSELELYGLPLGKALNQIKALSEIYGPDRIIWRYDPIVFWIENDSVKSNHDIRKFENLCKTISSFGIRKCYFSLVYPYQKFERRYAQKFPEKQIWIPDETRQSDLLDEIAEISSKYKIVLYSCCNDRLLRHENIKKGHCIDGNLLNSLDATRKITTSKNPTRQDCGCTKSTDIGDYLMQPCRYGCIYCYANPAGY